MQKYPTSFRLKERGFTLMELVIVLGAVGLLIGGVFVAARSVSNSNHINTTSQQVGQVAQNIREYYMNAQGIGAGCGDITGPIDKTTSGDYTNTGVFPSEMRSSCSTCTAPYTYRIDSAFISANGPNLGIKAGSFRVMGASCVGGVASRFQIVLTNLTPAACATLLFSGLSYRDQSMGITQVCGASEDGATNPCYNGVAASWLPVSCAAGVCSTTPALTLAQAQTMCDSASTSEVAWEFKVRN